MRNNRTRGVLSESAYICIPATPETVKQIDGQITDMETSIKQQLETLETLRRLKVYMSNQMIY